MSQPFLTVKQVAAILVMSESHVYQLVATGQIAFVDVTMRLGGRNRKVRFTQAQVDAFIAARSMTVDPPPSAKALEPPPTRPSELASVIDLPGSDYFM